MFTFPFTLFGGGHPVNAVSFDGTNDYLTRGADLTGSADGQAFSFSLFFKTADNSASHIFYSSGAAAGVELALTGSIITIRARDSGLANVAALNSTSTPSNDDWHHICGSFNGATSAENLYLDDVDVLSVIVSNSNTIDFTQSDHGIGARTDGSIKTAFDMAEFWYDDSYINFSDTATRRKFIDSQNKPVDLGPAGSIPTSSSPLIYDSGATASWHTNKGTGGGFTENGALTTASTSPSD